MKNEKKFKIQSIVVGMCLLVLASACKKDEKDKIVEDNDNEITNISFTNGNGVTDVEGNQYKTVIINGQEWMAENLKTSKYSNGDNIVYMPFQTTWDTIGAGAFCYFYNQIENNNLYGKLYNGYVVTDSRNACPTGWRIPTDEDWNKLEKYIGLPDNSITQHGSRGSNEGEHLKSKRTEPEDHPRFCSPNNATNKTGFDALPGGSRLDGGYGHDIGLIGYFWTSTPQLSGDVLWVRSLGCNSGTIGRTWRIKEFGLSIRCIKN